jgi:nicotinic acid phosphoribosyltransferase
VERAKQFCKNVKIVVSGGFTPEKIKRFETLGVPVDTYAVGSSLFDNHGPHRHRFFGRRGAGQIKWGVDRSGQDGPASM